MSPSRLASILQLLALVLAGVQVYDLIPVVTTYADPNILRKLVLLAQSILSTYGYRAALAAPTTSEKKEGVK